jgi:hypothetical protein
VAGGRVSTDKRFEKVQISKQTGKLLKFTKPFFLLFCASVASIHIFLVVLSFGIFSCPGGQYQGGVGISWSIANATLRGREDTRSVRDVCGAAINCVAD